MIGIYKITSPNKRIYIGQSIDIEKRFKKYKGLDCRNQIKLYRSLLKYGYINHKFETITECEIEQLNDLERFYQEAYNVLSRDGLNCRLTKTDDRSGKLSIETKLKQSNSKKGHKYNLGRIVSDETKLKISKGNKGKICSAETKRNMSDAKRNMSDETKQKISKSHKGKNHSDKTKLRMSEGHKGKLHSDEAKLKMSEAHKTRVPMTNETKLKMSESAKGNKSNLGNKYSEESKLKMSLSAIGKIVSDSTKQKLSEAGKNAWITRHKNTNN